MQKIGSHNITLQSRDRDGMMQHTEKAVQADVTVRSSASIIVSLHILKLAQKDLV